MPCSDPTLNSLVASGVNRLFEYGGLVIVLTALCIVEGLAIRAMWRERIKRDKDQVDLMRQDFEVKEKIANALEKH